MMKNRILATMLVLCMIVTLLPFNVLAAEKTMNADIKETIDDEGAEKGSCFQAAPPAFLQSEILTSGQNLSGSLDLTTEEFAEGRSGNADMPVSVDEEESIRSLAGKNPYFYAQLSPKAKGIYNTLRSTANREKLHKGETIYFWTSDSTIFSEENLNEEFDQWWASPEKDTYLSALLDVYEIFYLDNPDIFGVGCINYGICASVKNASGEWEPVGENGYFVPGREYAWRALVQFNVLEPWNGSRSIASDEVIVANKVQEITSKIDSRESRYVKLLYIHDQLTKNNAYNTAAENGDTTDGDIPWEALSALTPGFQPVCAGYAKAFKLLCDKLDIPCLMVGYGSHIWNYVQMENGNWYAVDVTWDDPSNGIGNDSGLEHHEYFLVGSDTVIYGQAFSQSHRTDKNGLKKDSGGYFSLPALSPTAYAYPVTVTFDSRQAGEDAIWTQEMMSCEKVSDPGKPARDNGYIFKGWYEDEACTKEYDFDTRVMESLTLYAKWEIPVTGIEDSTVSANGTAQFHVTAQGEGLTYQWRASGDDGATWEDLMPPAEGYNTDTLKITPAVSGEEKVYQCVVQDKYGNSGSSEHGRILVEYTVSFNSRGDDKFDKEIPLQKVLSGELAEDPGRIPEKEGYTFEGWFGDMACTKPYDFDSPVKSDMILYAGWQKKLIIITKQPEDFYSPQDVITEHNKADFSITAESVNKEKLTYQWQVSEGEGKPWADLKYATSGFNTEAIQIVFISNKEGYRYRCIVEDESGNTEISKEAKIIFGQKNLVKIIREPADFYVTDQNTAEFYVAAESFDGGEVEYRWQVSTDGGESWTDLSYGTLGFNSDTLKVEFIRDKKGYQYRCRARKKGWSGQGSDELWVPSRAAKLIFGQPTPTPSSVPSKKKIEITEQPEDYWGTVHSTAEFKISVKGEGIKYQWIVSKDNGSTWTELSYSTKGYNENILKISRIGSKEGYLYRCKLEDQEGNTEISDWAAIHISDKGEQHIYDQESVQKATLKRNGSIIKTCSACGHKKTIIIYYPKIITMSKVSYSYNGKKQTPPVIVKGSDGNKIAVQNYTVEYKGKRVDTGEYDVIVTFKGNYSGSKKLTYKITEAKNTIAASNITKTVSAKTQTFKINAKANGNAKLSYRSNNKSVRVDGSGKITVKKNFVGEASITITAAKTVNFKKTSKKITITVNPASVKLLNVKPTHLKGKLLVKWTVDKNVSGYEIQYSTDKKFGKNVGNEVVPKAATASVICSGLRAGKKYYVHIRTYKIVSGKKYYSKWSSPKRVSM